jgi:hypothetical protein
VVLFSTPSTPRIIIILASDKHISFFPAQRILLPSQGFHYLPIGLYPRNPWTFLVMMKFINSYRILPKELFRINNGPLVRLRPWDTVRKPRRFDIYLTDEGIALPKALDRASYKGKPNKSCLGFMFNYSVAPNGASMRPNSPYQHYLMNVFEGNNVLVYAVQEGRATARVFPGSSLLENGGFRNFK